MFFFAVEINEVPDAAVSLFVHLDAEDDQNQECYSAKSRIDLYAHDQRVVTSVQEERQEEHQKGILTRMIHEMVEREIMSIL